VVFGYQRVYAENSLNRNAEQQLKTLKTASNKPGAYKQELLAKKNTYCE
jgi:hypothetical protein